MLWNYDAHVAQKEREIAKSMKDKGLKIAMIAERTGLTPERSQRSKYADVCLTL